MVEVQNLEGFATFRLARATLCVSVWSRFNNSGLVLLLFAVSTRTAAHVAEVQTLEVLLLLERVVVAL